MVDNLQEIRNFAISVARTVGARVRDELYQANNLQVSFKSRRDVVTEIDFWSEQLIKKEISTHYPSHIVVGEETHQELIDESGEDLPDLFMREYCWVVDPLDGTVNFVNRVPHVGISLGLLIRGERSIAVVYDPARNEMFSAIRGQGAFMNEQKISTSEKTDLADCLVGSGIPEFINPELRSLVSSYNHIQKQSRTIRRFGAATLDFCWVACGRLDAYLEHKLKPWDAAAGSLLVEEAGGCVCNYYSSHLPLSLNKPSFLASGPGIYGTLNELMEEED